MKGINKLWLGLGILAFLSPLGLLASGTAWGEWGADEFSCLLGYIPKGLVKFSGIWKAPLSDYTISGISDKLGYILSGFTGIILIYLIVRILGLFLPLGDNETK